MHVQTQVQLKNLNTLNLSAIASHYVKINQQSDALDALSFAKKNDDKIKIGTLLNETNVEIKLGVDKLFASHIGIFGNTGSGKSYTLAKIYHELLNKYKTEPKFLKNTKFVIIAFQKYGTLKQQ